MKRRIAGWRIMSSSRTTYAILSILLILGSQVSQIATATGIEVALALISTIVQILMALYGLRVRGRSTSPTHGPESVITRRAPKPCGIGKESASDT
jgi:hypothetical protein